MFCIYYKTQFEFDLTSPLILPSLTIQSFVASSLMMDVQYNDNYPIDGMIYVSETTLLARVPTITKIIMRLFLSLFIFTLICLGVYVSVKAYYVLHMFENTYCKQHHADNT